VAPIVASQAVGIHAATVFTFSAQGTGFEAASLGYRWEFGDGATSTEPSPTHVYEAPGTYTVTVTVSDARQSARSDTSVTILALTGTWVRVGGGIIWFITQSGNAITGTSDVVTFNPNTGVQTVYTGCALSGSIQRGTPVAVTLTGPGCSHPQAPPLPPAQINLTVAPDGMTMTGVFSPVGQPPFPITVARQ
jgi:PKD repeat protein